ncbi:murein biosynthesis integral membrane protein MurJ [Nitratifractor sp.]
MRLRSVLSNSAGILLSRVFGLVRDLLSASILGANLYSDIFFVAFKLPNLFRRIFAEGAFSQSFLPSLVASRRKGLFSVRIFQTMLVWVLALALLVDFFAPTITRWIAPGFSETAIAEAARYVAIQFWYLPLIFSVTFFAALLQYRGHFATTAFSTVLLNIALIAGLLLSKGSVPKQVVEVLSWSVLVGGFLQLVVHIASAKRFGAMRIIRVGLASLGKKGASIREDTRRFYKNFFPAVWGNSTAQVMAFLDTWLASFLTAGSISFLYYANRIFQLPLALFAIALSVAIFPTIAKKLRHSQEAEALREMERGFWILLGLLGAATVVGLVFSTEIVWLLFERGAFGRHETLQTARVLQMYLVGLIPFGLGKLFSLWLYSDHRQLEAAKIATYSLLVYGVGALSLMHPMGAAGLALASSLAGIVALGFNIRAFGWERFLAIVLSRRKLLLFLPAMAVLLILSLALHRWVITYL